MATSNKSFSGLGLFWFLFNLRSWTSRNSILQEHRPWRWCEQCIREFPLNHLQRDKESTRHHHMDLTWFAHRLRQLMWRWHQSFLILPCDDNYGIIALTFGMYNLQICIRTCPKPRLTRSTNDSISVDLLCPLWYIVHVSLQHCMKPPDSIVHHRVTYLNICAASTLQPWMVTINLVMPIC